MILCSYINEELIPADGILTKGKAFIDYSFVTGESLPVLKEVGEMVYAGGKQTEGNIEILVVKEVAQSYLTKLWNRDEFKKPEETKSVSFVHLLSRYFTYIVFAIAAITAVYWKINDPSKTMACCNRHFYHCLSLCLVSFQYIYQWKYFTDTRPQSFLSAQCTDH